MDDLSEIRKRERNKRDRERAFVRGMYLSDIATIKAQAFRDGEERERQRREKIIAEERLLREEAESKAKEECRAKEALEKELAELRKKLGH